MKLRWVRWAGVSLLLGLPLHQAAHADEGAKRAGAAPGIDVAGIDRSVAPGDDFFRFANGNWFKNTVIPPDRGSFGVWSVLADQAQQRTRDILEHPAGGAGSDERRAADYYAAYMDDAAIEAAGTKPIDAFLKTIASIQDRTALTRWVCGEVRTDVDPLNATNFYTDHLFGVWVAPALDAPDRYVPYLLQGGLGMPDRDYYTDSSPAMQEVRSSYRAHVATLLKLAGVPEADQRTDRILDLEQKIAAVHSTRTESMDVLKGNNPWLRNEFGTRAPGLDWNACFEAAGLDAPRFIVWHPAAIAGVAKLVESEPLEAWRDYLAFHLVNHYANVLPEAFVDQRFAFYGKVLSGTPEQRPRWRRALDATNAALGDAVGRQYVARYFPPETRRQLEEMVANLIAAFDRRIDALDWMSPGTKNSAKAKLRSLRVGIGYPDKWQSYAGLEVGRGEALMNARRAESFDYKTNVQKIGRPVSRDEWAMTPQTVNALNLPVQNALNFPAAILAPPFFDPAAPPAVNYGAIGAVIGHEISHSFDDQGSQFDATGKLTNWWTPSDFEHFKASSAKLVAQYNAYEPLPGLHVNGQLTLSENIADVAGLSAAYDAYFGKHGAQPAAGNTFTDRQQFFLGFAQAWRTKIREPLLRQRILTDGHAPDEFRADTVRNLDAWYDAFDVAPGQRLYLPPPERVRVW